VAAAIIAFEFDPYFRAGDIAVRWETLGIAGAALVGMVAAALLALRTPPGADGGRLRLDDLLFLGLGVVPGAVIAGRIGYGLVHLDYYSQHPGALLDAGQGGFQLSLAVVGGAITGAYVARLLDAPVGRWIHVLAVPVLIALEGGKFAMAWGGTGQGSLTTEPIATSYLGPGPWGSLAPALPAWPSQILEAGLTALIGIVLTGALAVGLFATRDGRFGLVAFGAWLVVRLAVATTWRDQPVLGPLRADQLISLTLLAVMGGAFLAGRVDARRILSARAVSRGPEP
jgi:prolipoprotein diacylglyceryltransferase